VRDLLELLNVRVVYDHTDQGVKLWISCEIPGSEEDILLTFSSRLEHNNYEKGIVLSTEITL
jgi:hypothetical protein